MRGAPHAASVRSELAAVWLPDWGARAGSLRVYGDAMSSRASAPPTTARVEIGAGTVLAFIGALILVTRIGSIPGFIAEILIGFVSVTDFWPMVGGTLLLALGIFSVVRGRRGIRHHRRVVARLEAMHARQEQKHHGASGVSAGVAGTSHRMPTRF